MGKIRTITVNFSLVTKALLVACLLVGVEIHMTLAHVGLTFPPARKFDLDFLDNIRTKPPCGMPKGSIKTSLVSGSTINVTWHLSYPHRGGYRLELMDSQERTLLDLTPKNGDEDYIKGDPTAQEHQVKLPDNFTCDDCTIRLLRQASEWANQYRFWSCSDVDIVPIKKYKETCSGAGRSVVGRCVCNKGFWGPRCQYQDECETESECNGNGKCIDLGGTSLPRKQCFCSPGFHGEKCRKRNTIKLPGASQPLDLTRHTKRVLSDRMTLHYRILPAAKDENKEIEFIMIVKGTSYGAIGWRPVGFDKTCKRWPFIDNSTAEVERQGKNAKLQTAASDNSAVPESEPKAEGEPESSAAEPETTAKDKYKDKKHEGAAEPEPETASEPSSEPEVTTEPEVTSEPVKEDSKPSSITSRSKSGSTIADKLRSKLRNQSQKPPEGTEVHVLSSQIAVTRGVSKQRQKRSPEPEEGHVEPEPETAPEPEGKSEPVPESGSTEPEPEGSAKTESEIEPESEGEAEPGASDKSHSTKGGNRKDLKPSVWAPKGDFHAMDCIDLVMGAARGPLSRIRDYYTRDRSTPRLDSFWGGKEDITAATGWEEGDQTVLIFRRKLRASDEADHDIAGEMHVIWARGQENGEYVHSPKSGIESAKESPSRAEFYAPDEIKYHGHGAQRGVTRIDFQAEQTSGRKKTQTYDCENGWAHPPGCSNSDSSKPCSYNATWRYIPEIDSIKFTIETRKPDRWTGIGFSDTPQMRNSDAVIGWVTSGGQFFHMDTFMSSYTAPVLDSSQDISNMTGKYRDGIVHWSFLRKVKTADSKDVSLDECRFFLFPIEGGTYNPVNKKIRKHELLPIASSEKVCIPRQCRPVRVLKPAELRYEFDIKLTGGLGNNWRPPRKGSEDFMHLENRIGTDLGSELRTIKGFNRLQLTEIKRDGQQGALAKLELMVQPNSELAEKSRVERALNDTITTGRVGAFQIDPTYLRLKSPVLEQFDEDDPLTITTSAFGSQRLWIVIGCVAALIVLALIQAGLTIYKVAGKTSSHKGSSGSGMAWRDYSETNYGYDAYDEKTMGPNTMQLTATPQYPPNGHGQGHGHGNGTHHNSYSSALGGGHGGPPSMSLPRPQHSQPHSQNSTQSMRHNGGGGGSNNGLNHNPDFYFMPSQRKYSGEMVRVYVDNNKR